MAKRQLEYIKVQRNNRLYKVYLKDIRSVTRTARKSRPPVPSFHDKPLSTLAPSEVSLSHSLELQDLMEFEPFVFAN